MILIYIGLVYLLAFKEQCVFAGKLLFNDLDETILPNNGLETIEIQQLNAKQNISKGDGQAEKRKIDFNGRLDAVGNTKIIGHLNIIKVRNDVTKDEMCLCQVSKGLKNEDLSNLLKGFDGSKMDRINLGFNGLTKIDKNTFSGDNLVKLKELYLDNNKIESIEPNSFDKLVNLELLKLDNNMLTSLDVDLFQKLPKLKYLYLHFNKIAEYKKELFRNLFELVDLSLSGNTKGLPITADFFQDLHNLISLYLIDMNLTRIEKGSFKGLDKLFKLQISKNNITKIITDQFAEMKSLKELFLDNNNINTLEDYSFRGLSDVRAIYLINNNITPFNEKSYYGICKNTEVHINYTETYYVIDCEPSDPLLNVYM